MEIEIINQTRKKISSLFVKKIFQRTLFLSNRKMKQSSVSVIFVSKKRIRKLNRIYRKRNEPTDVLSFNYASEYNEKGGRSAVSEIILCPEVIEKSAKFHKVSFQRELAFVLSHGVLHLLGFRHGKKMYEIQDEISNLEF